MYERRPNDEKHTFFVKKKNIAQLGVNTLNCNRPNRSHYCYARNSSVESVESWHRYIELVYHCKTTTIVYTQHRINRFQNFIGIHFLAINLNTYRAGAVSLENINSNSTIKLSEKKSHLSFLCERWVNSLTFFLRVIYILIILKWLQWVDRLKFTFTVKFMIPSSIT